MKRMRGGSGGFVGGFSITSRQLDDLKTYFKSVRIGHLTFVSDGRAGDEVSHARIVKRNKKVVASLKDYRGDAWVWDLRNHKPGRAILPDQITSFSSLKDAAEWVLENF